MLYNKTELCYSHHTAILIRLARIILTLETLKWRKQFVTKFYKPVTADLLKDCGHHCIFCGSMLFLSNAHLCDGRHEDTLSKADKCNGGLLQEVHSTYQYCGGFSILRYPFQNALLSCLFQILSGRSVCKFLLHFYLNRIR